jgi:hypothetical protein
MTRPGRLDDDNAGPDTVLTSSRELAPSICDHAPLMAAANAAYGQHREGQVDRIKMLKTQVYEHAKTRPAPRPCLPPRRQSTEHSFSAPADPHSSILKIAPNGGSCASLWG